MNSRKRIARIAGVIYLIVAIFTAFPLSVFNGLYIAGDAAALGTAGANALVLMLLDTQHYAGLVSSIFMGLWLVPLGYLAYKSGMPPKMLGVALIAVCVCYHAKLLAAFLAPELGTVIQVYVSIPVWVFELWMVLYKLIIGVKTIKPAVHIPAVV